MSSKEVGIEQARKTLGDLAIAAQYGHTTILTRNGKPIARIAPLEDTMEIPALPTDEGGQSSHLAMRHILMKLTDNMVGLSMDSLDIEDVLNDLRVSLKNLSTDGVLFESMGTAAADWARMLTNAVAEAKSARPASNDPNALTVGARVAVPADAIPSDWPTTGEVVEVGEETCVVELDNGRRQELPPGDVTAL